MEIDKTFHYAAVLNNTAVALMERAEIYRAVGVLQESMAQCEHAERQLDHVRSISSSVSDRLMSNFLEVGDNSMTEDEGRPNSDACHRQGQLNASGTISSKYASIIPARLTMIQDTYSRNDNEIACFVDWRALKLDIDMLAMTPEPYFLNWVITYNLAMCYHYLGLSYSSRLHPTNRKYALLRAVQGYGFVHQVMAADRELQGDVWMLLVVVNNLSRAQLALGDTRRGNYCAKRLLAILMYIHEHEEMVMPRSLFEKYLTNVEGLILRKARTAAAA